MTAITALSPIDGRYQTKTQALSPYFSEYGLIYHRLQVEIMWLKTLSQCEKIQEVPPFSDKENAILDAILDNFDVQAAKRVKAIEATTNHDVKAVEYYLKEQLSAHHSLSQLSEFVHFAATSEDINNVAYALMLKGAHQQVIEPMIQDLVDTLTHSAKQAHSTAMLARTHGQAATPTTLGKELANVIARLKRQQKKLQSIDFLAKFNGAVGNFNAHLIAYPTVNWPALSQDFIEQLGLSYNAYSTQIEPHDYIAELAHASSRINTILLDLARDCWTYISMDYFKQKTVKGEVGSSTMPHKVNPIDFENAEGNLGIANALLSHFADKLPVSRLQRDLSDSTVLRSLGSAYGYSLIAYSSLLKGLRKLTVNHQRLQDDLDNHWIVLAEAIQTVMRRHGLEAPYEQLKALTRDQQVNQQTIHDFINELALSSSIKEHLLSLRPDSYLGLAAELTEQI